MSNVVVRSGVPFGQSSQYRHIDDRPSSGDNLRVRIPSTFESDVTWVAWDLWYDGGTRVQKNRERQTVRESVGANVEFLRTKKVRNNEGKMVLFWTTSLSISLNRFQCLLSHRFELDLGSRRLTINQVSRTEMG